MGDIIDFAEASAALLEKRRRERWHVAYGPDIAKPRPPISYVCRDLAISPGASIWGGSGFSGKTTTLMALMLAIVSGKKAWGHFDVLQGDVQHADFEQGPDLTYLKYQRQARCMGIDLDALGDRLACSSMPTEPLDCSKASQDELRWLFAGRKAGILDAFKGAFPEAEENASSARKYLDMVHKVGIEIGCAIITIAHSRKMIDGLMGDARSSLRGSSALYDAPQTVWILSGERDKPTRCENVKERLRGKLRETFGIAIEDMIGPRTETTDPTVLGDHDPEWGLNVRYLSPCDLQAAYTACDRPDNALAINVERIETVGRRIGDLLASAPDGLVMSSIRGLLHTAVTPLDINAAMPILLQDGSVHVEGRGATAVYRVAREPGED